MRLIYQGAEAKIYLSEGSNGRKIVKDRVAKGYRLPVIDKKLRSSRTRREVRMLSLARRAGVRAPAVFSSDGSSIELEFIQGGKVRDIFCNANAVQLSEEIASVVNRLHSAGIIHSDLTTSNMILSKQVQDGRQTVFLLDFGLSFVSRRPEDKAVDLRLLKQSLLSSHPSLFGQMWKIIEKSYASEEVIKRLSIIEKRGRYAKRRPDE